MTSEQSDVVTLNKVKVVYSPQGRQLYLGFLSNDIEFKLGEHIRIIKVNIEADKRR